MIKVKKDVSDKYYDMINSFNADYIIKVNEIQDDEIGYDKSFYEIEKELIKNEDKRLMNDIELLKELEFNLRHDFIKIVEIDREEYYE